MLSNLMLRESVSDTIPIFTEERTEACLKGLFKITADMHQGQYLNPGQPAVTNHAGLTLSYVGLVSCILFSVNFGKERVA